MFQLSLPGPIILHSTSKIANSKIIIRVTSPNLVLLLLALSQAIIARHLTCDGNPGLTKLLENCICNLIGIRLPGLLRHRQTPYNFSLPLALNSPIAEKGRQNFLMPQVLAPRLELLRGLADILAKPDKGIPKTMRVEIRQTGTVKGFTKDLSNGSGIAPVLPCQPRRCELVIRS